MTVSVVITNHDYGRFLAQAIDSALGQADEVVVVDDGSTDDSRGVIARYGERVRPVLKERGGHTSAVNAGLEHARGEVVVFLDADDALLPGTLTRAAALFDDGVVHVHWPLREIDEDGRPTGRLRPEGPLASGDLRNVVLRDGPGPESYTTPPTSGSAWARAFLERVCPIPERRVGRHAHGGGPDAYLAAIAPLYGGLRALPDPGGLYRAHGANQYAALPFEDKLELDRERYAYRCELLAEHCAKLGLPADPDGWRARSWLHRFPAAREEIAALVAPGRPFVLVDDQQLGDEVAAGRRPIPFLERDGAFDGPPADDATALRELERLRDAGAEAIVFAWPAFWWLEHYGDFADALQRRYPRVLDNERLVAFDLR